VIAIVACVMVVGSGEFWGRMQTMLHPSQDYNWVGASRAGRAEVWRRGIGYMVSHPVFGTGLNTFWVAEGTLSDAPSLLEQGIGSKWSTAHNSFVLIGAELGVPGLLTFLLLLGYMMRRMWRLSKPSRGPPVIDGTLLGGDIAEALVGSLCAYCVGGFFLSQAYSKVLYVGLIPLAAGLSTLRRSLDRQVRGTSVVRRRGRRRTPEAAGWPAI